MQQETNFRNIKLIEEEDFSLRPKFLKEYIGQPNIVEMLTIFIKTAKNRNEVLDHVLLYGPPGLGKTTLAYVVANEMNANIKTTNGAILNKPGDIAAILSSLEEGDILFIDEIHRIPKKVEEILYSAMEDYKFDVVVGKGTDKLSITIDLPPFTLIGATTRFGDLSSPLRERFGIVHQLSFYNMEDLINICERTSKIFNININKDAATELAKRSRGTPRILNRLFKRVRDFAEYYHENIISIDTTMLALDKLNIDSAGLDEADRRYLNILINIFHGGPVGVDAIASSMQEERVTIEDVYEPFLLQSGFILRTPRGRVATPKAYQHLNTFKKGDALCE